MIIVQRGGLYRKGCNKKLSFYTYTMDTFQIGDMGPLRSLDIDGPATLFIKIQALALR